MKHLLPLLALMACVDTRSVSIDFGSVGEGLDGFMCKDAKDDYLLDRLGVDAGSVSTSLVFDFVHLGGVPGCRSGQLVSWCASHDCSILPTTRSCGTVSLPTNGEQLKRSELRTALLAAMRDTGAFQTSAEAPDEFVLVRVVGTSQPCSELLAQNGGALPAFDQTRLIGCAYSCPVLFNKVEQDVYLGFETLTENCEQGVRTCSDGQLHWQE
jgi:hypothetical protein